MMMTGTATELIFALTFNDDDTEKADWSPDMQGVKWQQQNPHPLQDSAEKGQYWLNSCWHLKCNTQAKILEGSFSQVMWQYKIKTEMLLYSWKNSLDPHDENMPWHYLAKARDISQSFFSYVS